MKKIILTIFTILMIATMLIGTTVLASAEATDPANAGATELIPVPELPVVNRPYKTMDELGIDFAAYDAYFPEKIEIKREGSTVYIQDIGAVNVSISGQSCDLELKDGYWTGDIEGDLSTIYIQSFEEFLEDRFWSVNYNENGERLMGVVLNDDIAGVYVMFSYEDGYAAVIYDSGDCNYDDRYTNGVLETHTASSYQDKELVNQVVYDANGEIKYCTLLTDNYYYYLPNHGWSSSWETFVACDAPAGYENVDLTYFTANKPSLICSEAYGDDMLHDMSVGCCTAPSTCKNGCGYTIGEIEHHTWQTIGEQRVCSVCDLVFFPEFELVERVYPTVEETGFPYAEYRALFPEVLTVKYEDGKYMIKDVGADNAETGTSVSDYVELSLVDGWWIYELDEEIYNDESISISVSFEGNINGLSWDVNYYDGEIGSGLSIDFENSRHAIDVYYYDYDWVSFIYYVGNRQYEDTYSHGVLSAQNVSMTVGHDLIDIEYSDDGTVDRVYIYRNKWFYYFPETGWSNDEAPEGYEDLDVEFIATLVPTTINCAHEAYNEADCTNPERCAVCGIAKEGSVPIGHNYVGEIMLDPTCSEVGTMRYTCQNDRSHYYYEDVAIVEDAHAWDDGEVTTEPTCTEKGTKTFTCQNDEDHTYTEDVNALGHTEEAVASKAPTCTEAGLTDGTKCSVCDETLTAQTEIAALGHKYDNACDSECNTCGEERTPAEHVDADENNSCDECGAELPKDGLSGGAIAGIATGSAVVLGGGGFSLWWFVFRKKKLL